MARMFVAVWPPVEVLDAIAGLGRARRPGVRWTSRDQWHVTLRFLGECDPAEAARALAALGARRTRAVIAGPPGRLGRNVLVVAVSGLDDVATAVVAATAGVGVAPDPRPFHGHLTLARLQGVPACSLVEGALQGAWDVDEVALVRSTLARSGARYETVGTFPLL